MLVALALIGSAWLAYASSAPKGTSSYPPPSSTTTTVGRATTTTTAPKTTTTTAPKTTTTTAPKTTTTTAPKTTTTVVKECKPGYGYGDKNHCHSGPPGQNKKHDDNKKKDDHGQSFVARTVDFVRPNTGTGLAVLVLVTLIAISAMGAFVLRRRRV
jgi:LPXTG-motif cell wall-anchored protein